MAWKCHAIAQTQLRKARHDDGVGRPKFDFHTGDAAAVADDELARGVALVQQVHHYLSPANLADDEYLRGLQEATGGYVDLAALAAFPNLAAMGADVASLARVLKHSRLVELDPTGTLVRPRPRESAAA